LITTIEDVYAAIEEWVSERERERKRDKALIEI
jgi:hypothetical protein